MGFRGEALASIAAVANVELVSKTENQETGYRVVVEAGDVLEREETGCRTGTTITVKNLFFNTPVRYKFLKKDYTESGYIEDVITRIALVNPNVAIKLINTGKTVIQTNGSGNLKDVVYSIYGKDVASSILEVNYQYEDILVTGVIGKPEIARSNRSHQLFFVNKRYIKDKTLTAATEQSYKGLIPIGKFGFTILNLEMNPAKVDVNVHPAKLEVRFQEENKVFQAVYHAIKETLLKGELVANTEKVSKDEENGKRIDRTTESFEERLRNIREAKKENNQGLFGFRKQNSKQIEKYTEDESKIKTNILEDVYNSKNDNEIQDEKGNKEENTLGNPIDTTDVLEQLKKMRAKLESELNESKVNNLSDVKAEYKLEDNVEGEENKKEENNQKDIENETKINKENKQDIEVTEEQKEKINKVNDVIENINNKEIKEEFGKIKQNMEELNNNPQVVSEDFDEMYRKLFGRSPIADVEEKKEEKEDSAIDIVKSNISMFDTDEKFQKPKYKFIGIVFKTYIILEIGEEMYILDQHAAHERIMYERVKKNYYSDKTKDSQLLLLPDVITLTHKEMDIAKENTQMFEQAGFTFEEFGENTIKLTGVPTICIDLDTKELFLETLDEINTVARTAKQEKEEKFIATVACKAAVKANMALTTEEVEKLMDELLKLPNPFTCPHGRPTVIKMTKYDIERKFARK